MVRGLTRSWSVSKEWVVSPAITQLSEFSGWEVPGTFKVPGTCEPAKEADCG